MSATEFEVAIIIVHGYNGKNAYILKRGTEHPYKRDINKNENRCWLSGFSHFWLF